MNFILNKVVLFKVNWILEKSKKKKIIDINLIENKYKNFNISFILFIGIKNDLFVLLNNLYYNVFLNNNFYKFISYKIYEIIFYFINYKNLGGIRLEVKGRLIKCNRVDRVIYKLKWKGGLKNIDFLYKGIFIVNMRGFFELNLEYLIFIFKCCVGVFVVKGWISGK